MVRLVEIAMRFYSELGHEEHFSVGVERPCAPIWFKDGAASACNKSFNLETPRWHRLTRHVKRYDGIEKGGS